MWFTTTDYTIQVKILLLSINGVFLLAAAGAPAIALFSERLAVSRKKVFYDKFGLQIAFMGLLLVLCTLPLTVGSWAVLHFRPPAEESRPLLPLLTGLPALVCNGLYLVSLLFLVLYKSTWKSLRNTKWLHGFIGLIALAGILLSIYLFLALERAHFLYGDILTVETSILPLLEFLSAIPPASAFWPVFALVLVLGLSIAGAMGLGFLLLRRNKDDYGRDYYHFSLRYCAKWAMFPGILAIPLMLWLAQVMGVMDNQDALIALVSAAVVMLLAVIMWNVVRRSENPLRHKPAILTATLSAMLVVTALGFCLAILFFQ